MADNLSLLSSRLKFRRFDESTLRIMESLMSSSEEVNSMLDFRCKLVDFLRSESLIVFRQASDNRIELKLLTLDFFVRAFAIVDDLESCLSLRYEGLVMRDSSVVSHPQFRVSSDEWMKFAEDAFDNTFYSVAAKACENALSCFSRKGDASLDNFFENTRSIDSIQQLKDAAIALSSKHSGCCILHWNLDICERLAKSWKIKELRVEQRTDAVNSLVFEANARIRDPVYGCVGAISYLQNQVSELQMQLAVAQTQIMSFQMQQNPSMTLIQDQIQQLSDDKPLFLPSTDFGIMHDYLNFAGLTSNVIQDPLKRESLWT